MGNYIRHTETKRMNLVNPYPGLRPFSTHDSPLFFGRGEEVEGVVNGLMKNRFIAITGEPGSGKTSMVNAGIVPALMYKGEWILFKTRPGYLPLQSLYHEILTKQGKATAQAGTKLPDPEFIMQSLREMHKEYQAAILLVVDQFEEVFTLKSSVNEQVYRKNMENYIDFLLKIVGQQDIPVHVVITIRTDFLGECSAFNEFSDLIDLYHYPLRRMSPENITRVIMGPLEVVGVGIQRELVKKILADVSDNDDLLPVLQHSLMKTWQVWNQRKDPESPISIKDYEQLGSTDHAISKSADEAYGQLSDEEKGFCERIFKALSERDDQNRDICIPLKISRISEITMVPVDKVIRIADMFRREGRGFIVPSLEVPLEKSSVISISHESLMKLWYRLDEWADDEYESVQMYLNLAEAAEAYQVGKAELWRPPDLEAALEWYRKNNPTMAWAERYNPAFERTMVFLTTSEREFAAEEEERFQEDRSKRVLNRVLTGVLAGAVLIAIVIFSIQRAQNPNPENQTAPPQINATEENPETAQPPAGQNDTENTGTQGTKQNQAQAPASTGPEITKEPKNTAVITPETTEEKAAREKSAQTEQQHQVTGETPPPTRTTPQEAAQTHSNA